MSKKYTSEDAQKDLDKILSVLPKAMGRKRTKGKGWRFEPERHSLSSYGIKTTFDAKGKRNGKENQYTMEYRGQKIEVTEMPNAHKPYEPEIAIDYDDEDGSLIISGFYPNFSREIYDYDSGSVIVMYYKPDGTEVRYKFDMDEHGVVPTAVLDKISTDLIVIPLHLEFWVEEFPENISVEAYELFGDMTPDAVWNTMHHEKKLSPGATMYSLEFEFYTEDPKAKELYKELKESKDIMEFD